MKINRIFISGFGKLVNKEYLPKDDLLFVDGCEKAGEVVFDFIRSALYGFHGKNGDERRVKYYPEDSQDESGKKVVFGGELLFEVYGKNFRVSCNWGKTSDRDYVELSDYDLARSIRVEIGKTIGEYALRMTEGTFVSACFSENSVKYIRNQEGSYNIGKISSFLGVNDGKPTINEIILSLKGKLNKIRSPKDKSGELDDLIVKQLKMKSQMTRLGDFDGKISDAKQNIAAIEAKKEELQEKLNSNEKVYLLANGAKLLLTKDKIANLYASMIVTMKQLDFQREELKRLQNEKGFKHVYPGILMSIIGILFIVASILFNDYQIFSLILKLVAVLVIASGLLVSIISFAKYLGRFKISANGRQTTVNAEVKRLENELSDKVAEFTNLIGDEGIVSLSKQWRKSEEILMNATDSERRFAILKSVDELFSTVEELKLQIAPLEKELNYQKVNLDNILHSSGTAYADAAIALNGLDAKIKSLSSKVTSLQIAIDVAIETKSEFDNVIIPMIISQGSKIYKAITGDMGIFSLGTDYSINGRCKEPEKAFLAIKASVCQAVSKDAEKQIFVVSGEKNQDLLKDILRFSNISQIICER